MPIYDFHCPSCQEEVYDVYLSYTSSTHACSCGVDMERMWTTNRRFSFEPFTVELDGQQVEISSLHQLREIERTSEKKYLNGEGQPLVWRAYSQDPSNQDRNSLGEPQQQKFNTRNSRGVPYVIRSEAQLREIAQKFGQTGGWD